MARGARGRLRISPSRDERAIGEEEAVNEEVMVAFKSFSPDPDILDPEDEYFGTGQWTYEDGSSMYGQGDREEALRLLMQSQPDMRTAENAQPEAPAPPPVPGTEALNANAPQADVPARPAQLGGTSLPAQPPRPPVNPMAGMPRSIAGLRPGAAEMRGAPMSPEQIEDRQQSVYDQTMTQVAGIQQAAAERQAGRDEALQMVADHTERVKADREGQIQRELATKAEAEQNIQSAMATQLDPGRVIKQMSAGDMVLGAIALMVGGVGQTLQQRGGQRGAQNMALNTMQKAIDDDVEEQKKDKQSRLAHWTRVFNDADMGEKAARAEMWNAAGRLVEYQAQHKAGNADIQAQMMQDSATLMARGQAEAQALVDRENERLTIRYAPPEVPNGQDPVELLTKRLAARKAYEDAGATPEQLSAFDAAMGIPHPGGESSRQQKTREDKEKVARDEAQLNADEGKAEAAWESIQQFGATVGLQRDPKTGKYEDPGGFKGMQAPGLQEVIPGMLGKGKPIEAARQVAIDALARLQTGAAISKEEEERFANMLGNQSATRSELAVTLNAIRSLIESRRKANRVQSTGAPSAWK
jgi:hypothetical protein